MATPSQPWSLLAGALTIKTTMEVIPRLLMAMAMDITILLRMLDLMVVDMGHLHRMEIRLLNSVVEEDFLRRMVEK